MIRQDFKRQNNCVCFPTIELTRLGCSEITVLARPNNIRIPMLRIDMFNGDYVSMYSRVLHNPITNVPHDKWLFNFAIHKAELPNGEYAYQLSLLDLVGIPALKSEIAQMIAVSAVMNFINRNKKSDIRHLVISGLQTQLNMVLPVLSEAGLSINQHGFVVGDFHRVITDLTNPLISIMSLTTCY